MGCARHPLLRYARLQARACALGDAADGIDALALLPLLLELSIAQRAHAADAVVRFLSSRLLAALHPRPVDRQRRRALLACVIIFTGVLLGAASPCTR